MSVDFIGPPPTGKSEHNYIAEELRARPDEWAVVQRKATTTRAASAAQAIRSGKLRAYAPPGSFEAKSRTVGGEHRVYARYLGGLQ
ncbi:hypothetical protein [Streptomyces rapamycinicus]|uniref:Uncharacterized protein n=2 Tax=Streptomyces rapamycinicus TaxID=1226757 RepID=A0A0A0NIN2_STRRN|nr:hypothetical protein [Streptomyces rapamycinicus]AGP56839.1 hypothetical protein M271_26845 [Streptomyces rapamycinicus NRRL 5491]MBB4784459.1 hypothetical protein [Streptomyces rapamycinicus]RLV80058.1 hypothetical protein D3C57_116775 [Streptomyces rapamycinicus NRRL 5491]UTO64767.1 hypothetical protein LJB45_22170 [Streptomyces rapamycinicus]UTP32724.1 hypothetical protein LIV37_27295 [Streptomyces rapamycinicus NRRL 5491]